MPTVNPTDGLRGTGTIIKKARGRNRPDLYSTGLDLLEAQFSVKGSLITGHVGSIALKERLQKEFGCNYSK